MAQSLHELGVLKAHLGAPKEAEEMLTRALSIREGVLGDESPATVETVVALGSARRQCGSPEVGPPFHFL
eukprot:8445739-Pyramimonas_sp.AAC.2